MTTSDNSTKGRLLTIKEAAQVFDGLTEYRVRQMCKSKLLPYFKAGSKILIYEENLYKAITGGMDQTDIVG